MQDHIFISSYALDEYVNGLNNYKDASDYIKTQCQSMLQVLCSEKNPYSKPFCGEDFNPVIFRDISLVGPDNGIHKIISKMKPNPSAHEHEYSLSYRSKKRNDIAFSITIFFVYAKKIAKDLVAESHVPDTKFSGMFIRKIVIGGASS